MKILKKIVYSLIIFIALVLIVAAFAPKKYAVERETTINKPNTAVFNYVKFLKNQENYSSWATMDPNMKRDFSGTDGTVGFVSAWDSEDKDVGKGEQEIIAISENERIDYELRFFEPFEATDNAYMTTTSTDFNTTVVKWGFNGEMAFPMNIMLLFMNMEEMLGKDLEDGLGKLKGILENQ